MDLKDRILQTACDLFLRLGLRSVSIDDICNDIHISKKTFYTHYKTKDELVSYALDMFRKIHNSKREFAAEDNAIDIVMRNTNIFKKNFDSKYEILFFDLQKYYPDIYALHEREMRKFSIDLTYSLLQRGIGQGYFKQDMNVEAMAIFISSNVTTTFSMLRSYAHMTRAQAMDFILEQFMSLVLNSNGYKYYNEKKSGN